MYILATFKLKSNQHIEIHNTLLFLKLKSNMHYFHISCNLFILYLCTFQVNNTEMVKVELNLIPRYTIGWIVKNGKTIIFDICAETKGYVGLGFSITGNMKDADIFVGGVNDDGTFYFEDRYAIGQTIPILDEIQDYKLITASENDTHTCLKISRLLNTCDSHDLEISKDGVKLIWSLGVTDALNYHGENRGVYSVYLLDPIMPQADLSMYENWRMMSDLPLPQVDTIYWCTIHKTPPITGKNHAIGFDAVLPSKEAIKHTHHIGIYKCIAPEGQDAEDIFDNYLQHKHKGVDCYYTTEYEFPLQYCQLLEYGWGIGGRATIFPDHVGFPFMGDEYYRMEIHYDNPVKIKSVELNTGLEIYYTNMTRKYDAAFLQIGSVSLFSQMIPPNSVDFIQTGHCGVECTNLFPYEGLNVFNIFLHSHKSGRGIKVRLWRKGVEMPWVINDDNYDFNYQQNRPLREEFKVLRGDHFVAECRYDTLWRKGLATINGLSTSKEMCQVYFLYYPKMNHVIECISFIPIYTVLKFIGIENVTISPNEEDPTVTAPENLNGKKFTKVIEMLNWTLELRTNYQKLHKYSPHDSICLPGVTRFKSEYPKVKDFVPQITSCQST